MNVDFLMVVSPPLVLDRRNLRALALALGLAAIAVCGCTDPGGDADGTGGSASCDDVQVDAWTANTAQDAMNAWIESNLNDLAPAYLFTGAMSSGDKYGCPDVATEAEGGTTITTVTGDCSVGGATWSGSAEMRYDDAGDSWRSLSFWDLRIDSPPDGVVYALDGESSRESDGETTRYEHALAHEERIDGSDGEGYATVGCWNGTNEYADGRLVRDQDVVLVESTSGAVGAFHVDEDLTDGDCTGGDGGTSTLEGATAAVLAWDCESCAEVTLDGEASGQVCLDW